MAETRKILGDDDIAISATCVRVPVYNAHSESVNVQTREDLSPERCREVLSAFPGVVVVDDPAAGRYPMPIDAAGHDEVFVGPHQARSLARAVPQPVDRLGQPPQGRRPEGLLGHDVHVLVGPGDAPFPAGPVKWIPMQPPLGAHQLRWARSGAVKRIAEQLRPDVIMERSYNFGGEAIVHAKQLNARAVLEVNAPVVDHPGSTKALIDAAMIVRPMQRWRERLCAAADLIVTPAAAILPPATPPAKILEAEWGADTVRFHPGAAGPLPFAPPPGSSPSSPERFAAGMARSILHARFAACGNEDDTRSRRCSSVTARSWNGSRPKHTIWITSCSRGRCLIR